MIPGPLCLNRLHKQIVSILLLFRNSQFSVSMCMSTHICENTCVYMCVNVHVYVDVHTNARCWCWCLLCYSLPFILRQAPPLNVELADLARLAGQGSLGIFLSLPSRACIISIGYNTCLFFHMGTEDWAQVLKFVQQALSWLSHLSSLVSLKSWVKIFPISVGNGSSQSNGSCIWSVILEMVNQEREEEGRGWGMETWELQMAQLGEGQRGGAMKEISW